MTTGVDTFIGNAGDDTFIGVASALASANTLNNTDTIDGGGGTGNTLTVSMSTNFTGFTTGSVTNVETISLTNSGTVARTFDATGVTGATGYTLSGAISKISDMSAIAEITMVGQQSAFTTAMDSTFTALSGITDAMTLNVSGVGTAAVAASTGVAAVAEVAVALTLGSIEAVTINATGTNVISNGGINTSLDVTGAGNVKINSVASTLTSFDASASTGNVNVNLLNAGATSLTTVAMGAGNDTVTLETADILANGTMSGGIGADTLSLVSAAGGVVQYELTGFDTVAATNVDTALTFSAINSTGITAVSTVNGNSAATTFSGMGSGALSINGMGTVVVGGVISSDHTGNTEVNLTALASEVAAKVAITNATVANANSSTGSLVVNVGEYVDNSGSVITANKATSVTLNIASGMTSATTPAETTTFDGVIAAALASSVEINATGILNGTVQAAAATSAVITNGSNAGTVVLTTAALQELTVTTGKALDMSTSDLSKVQVLKATVDDGLFDMTDTATGLDSIATLTVGGTGVTNATAGTTDSSATFDLLGGNNAYDMNITATGLKGGFKNEATTNVASGQDITFTGSAVTGAVLFVDAIGGVTAGKNVTLTTSGTGGAVDYHDVTGTGAITVTNSGAGIFTIDAISAGVTGAVKINLDGTIGVVNVGTIAGKTVDVDVSNTIGGVNAMGTITALNSATLALSSLQANGTAKATITAAATSTALTAAVTGGINDDDVVINDVVTSTSITVTGDLVGQAAAGTDTLLVDADASTAATMAINISGLSGYETSIINVKGATAAGTTQTITGGAFADTITFEVTNTLTAADTVTGGASATGTVDTLLITDAAGIDADFTNVTGIETLKLGANSVVVLATEAQQAGITTVSVAAAGTSSIDASAMTSSIDINTVTGGTTKKATVKLGTAADTLTLAATGTADAVHIAAATLSSTLDTITSFVADEDVITFTGLTNADLRGDGDELDTDGGTAGAGLAADTGILTSSVGEDDLEIATAIAYLANYEGATAASDLVAGDSLYFAIDDATDSALFYFDDTNSNGLVDTGEVAKIITFVGVANAASLIGADFATFT